MHSRSPQGRQRRIRLTRLVPLSLLAAALSACSSERTLLESDVPIPPNMESVRSADIRREGGTVTGGRFLLAGEVNDAGDAIEATSSAYRANGWSVVSETRGLDRSTAVYRKGARTARLAIERRTLSPDNSTGTLDIAVESAAAPTEPASR